MSTVYQTLRIFVFLLGVKRACHAKHYYVSLFLNFLELGLGSLLAKPVLSSLVVALSANLSLF